MAQLPSNIERVGVPPLKCQGIKTKLVPFIFRSIAWTARGDARWIEPFLGSGVVALNLAPKRALLSDTNRHIIGLYKAIQQGELNQARLRAYLVTEGKKLAAGGADYYYRVRERFNREGAPLDFLFLNRCCFNGVMRFNRGGRFNVPFGHKPQRFTPAYITKIVNQVSWAAEQMQGKDWEFRQARWDEILPDARPEDFIYMDPPYIGRHTDYYNAWDAQEAARLAAAAKALACGFALSMWLKNRFRKNGHIAECWSGLDVRVCTHFYHVGARVGLRHAMDEALLIRKGFATSDGEERPESGGESTQIT